MDPKSESNVSRIRELIRAGITKPKTPLPHDNSEELFTMSLALTAAVKKTFFEKSEMKFSSEPLIEKNLIVQFMHRMRVDAMEKFNVTTIFSVVHFYQNVEAMQYGKVSGALAVYIEKKFVPEILRMLKYPYIDYDDDNEVKEGCGAIVNLLAGQFKKEISVLGYRDLEMSHFTSYVNTFADGIEFPAGQKYKYEISFEIDDKKRMVVEMIMGDILKD